MPFWIDFFFIEAATPVIEQIIFFHDHSIIVVFTFLFFLILIMFHLSLNYVFNLNLIENQFVEGVWTFVPILFLLFIVVPSLRLLYLIEELYTPDMTIKVVGHQWYWSYEYSEFNLKFDSFLNKDFSFISGFRLLETDTYLIFPVNLIVRFLVSRADVIHSFALQSMGVKVDAIPGRLNQLNVFLSRPGLFYGQCSEICGINHRFMPISVKVVSLKNFLKRIY